MVSLFAEIIRYDLLITYFVSSMLLPKFRRLATSGSFRYVAPRYAGRVLPFIRNRSSTSPNINSQQKDLISFDEDRFDFDASTDRRVKNTSIDAVIQVLEGTDELSMLGVIDKARLLCFVSLKNFEEIDKMNRKDLIKILTHAGIPKKYHDFPDEDMKSLVKNIMLAVTERMDSRELRIYLNKIHWSPMEQTENMMRLVLRRWVCEPSITQYKVVSNRNLDINVKIRPHYSTKLPLFPFKRIDQFSDDELVSYLTELNQPTNGSKDDKVNRLRNLQEYLFLHVFDEHEVRQFLTNICWTSSLNRLSGLCMRKRALLWLRHPICSKHILNLIPAAKPRSQHWSEEEDAILFKAFNETLSYFQFLGFKKENIDTGEVTKLEHRKKLSPKDDLDFHKRLELASIPIFAYDGYLKLWSKLEELRYMREKPRFWQYLAASAYYKYDLRRNDYLCSKRWSKLRVQNCL